MFAFVLFVLFVLLVASLGGTAGNPGEPSGGGQGRHLYEQCRRHPRTGQAERAHIGTGQH